MYFIALKCIATPPHLQLLLVEVAKPLQRNHLVEAVQEGFGLLLHPAGEPPVGQQTEGRKSDLFSWFRLHHSRIVDEVCKFHCFTLSVQL